MAGSSTSHSALRSNNRYQEISEMIWVTPHCRSRPPQRQGLPSRRRTECLGVLCVCSVWRGECPKDAKGTMGNIYIYMRLFLSSLFF